MAAILCSDTGDHDRVYAETPDTISKSVPKRPLQRCSLIMTLPSNCDRMVYLGAR
jgi:hypothetical protein